MLEKGKSSDLPNGRISYKKIRDLNSSSRCEGHVIKATEFHPKAAVALVAGINGTASLFQVIFWFYCSFLSCCFLDIIIHAFF